MISFYSLEFSSLSYFDMIKLLTDSHFGNFLEVKHMFCMQKNVNSKNDNSNAKPMLVLKFKETFYEMRLRPLVNGSLVDTISILHMEDKASIRSQHKYVSRFIGSQSNVISSEC